MEVGSATSGVTDSNIVSRDQTGFAGLNADAFMKLLIAQLQNQDPTEPLSNEDLLNQLSMMRNLQSNIELGNALKSITTSQQLTTATTFIGKRVSGFNPQNRDVSGVVDRAFLSDGEAFVGIGAQVVALSKVMSVEGEDAG